MLLGQLSRLPDQIATRTKNIAILREALGGIDGVRILAPKPEATRQGMYCLSLSFDPKIVGGVPRDVFVSALQAEGIPVTAPYEIVYQSELWEPGAKLWRFPQGADPAQQLGLHSHCPVAERISKSTGIVVAHQALLGDRADVADIAEAIAKVVRLSGQLRWKVIDRKLRGGVKKLLRMK